MPRQQQKQQQPRRLQQQHGIIADGNAPDAGYHGSLLQLVVFARLRLGRWLPLKRNRTESQFNPANKSRSILTHYSPLVRLWAAAVAEVQALKEIIL